VAVFLRSPDQELRNVIDKLAQFVARNGPEFEKMTMEKQKDNPKFSFLFGGEFYSYYKCKLALEQQQRESPELAGPACNGGAGGGGGYRSCFPGFARDSAIDFCRLDLGDQC
jgi:hypothetical protein